MTARAHARPHRASTCLAAAQGAQQAHSAAPALPGGAGPHPGHRSPRLWHSPSSAVLDKLHSTSLVLCITSSPLEGQRDILRRK